MNTFGDQQRTHHTALYDDFSLHLFLLNAVLSVNKTCTRSFRINFVPIKNLRNFSTENLLLIEITLFVE